MQARFSFWILLSAYMSVCAYTCPILSFWDSCWSFATVLHLQSDLKKEREELRRQKEALQKQIDFYQVRGYPTSDQTVNSPSLSTNSSPRGSTTDLHNSSSGGVQTSDPQISHKRSHSADLMELDNAQMFVDSKYSASLTEPLNMKEMRAQHFSHSSTSPDRQTKTGSAGNLTKSDKHNSQGSLKKTSNNNIQQIPSKLVTPSGSTKSSASNRLSKSMLPLNLAESGKKGSKAAKDGAKTPGQGKKADVIYF